MRTRRAAGAPEAALSTRSGGLATRSTTTSRKRKAPVANNAKESAVSETPARSARSRSASTRTPLANKNAHSSSTGAAFSGSDLIPTGSDLADRAFGVDDDNEDHDDVALSKQKTSKVAVNPTKTAANTTRPSLSQLVDEALKPLDEPAPSTGMSSKLTTSSNLQARGAVRPPSSTSTSTRTSSSTKPASVASLLSSRKAARKQTVATGGFYGQVQRAPIATSRTAPPAAATASSKTRASAADLNNTLNFQMPATADSDQMETDGSDEDREVQTLLRALSPPKSKSKPASVKAVQKNLTTSSKHPATSAAKNYAFKRSGHSHATTSGSRASQNIFARPKRGLVVWDDEEDRASDEEDEENVEMKGDEKAKDFQQDQLRSPSEHSSSDKENRDPHASQTVSQVPAFDPHRTIGAAPTSKMTRTPPPASRTQQSQAHLIRTGQTSVNKKVNRTPFAVLVDVAPSHSTPLSSGPRMGRSAPISSSPLKKMSTKGKGKQKAIVSEVRPPRQNDSDGHGIGLGLPAIVSHSTQSKLNASASGSSGSQPLIPTLDLSSSIPASDDVFLYVPPGSSAMPELPGVVEDSLPMLGLDESEKGIGIGFNAEDDEGLQGQKEPGQEHSLEEDFIRWPEQENNKTNRRVESNVDENAGTIGDDQRAETLGEKSFDSLAEDLFPGTGAAGATSAVAARRRSVADNLISFDQENDPYGFFAAEAKLRVLREQERALKVPPGLDTLDELLDGGTSKDAVVGESALEAGRSEGCGLDLRTQYQPFASPSPAQSEDEEGEHEKGGFRTQKHGKGKYSSSQNESSVAAAAATPADADGDESRSPVRRSTRVRQQKEPVMKLSDSETSSDAEKFIPKRGTKNKSKRITTEEDHDENSEAYDSDLPPPGFTRDATAGRRRAGLTRPTAEEPFDSEDEGEGRTSSGSSLNHQNAVRKRATSKRGHEKELRLSDLVKLLPRRSRHVSAATYGNKSKGRPASSSKAVTASTSSSDSSDEEVRREQRESSVESLSELPDTKALTARERVRPKTRTRAPPESDVAEKNEDFSEDSGDDEEDASARPKRSTAARRVVSASSIKASKSSSKVKTQGKKSATAKSKNAAPKFQQDTTSRAEPNRRSHRKETAGRSSDSTISKSSISSGRKRARDETEDEGKSAAGRVSSSRRPAKQWKQTTSAKEGKGAASNVRGRPNADERPRDELDDFELDTELVI